MTKIMNPIVVALFALFMTASFSVEAAQQAGKSPKPGESLKPNAKTKAEGDEFNAIAAMKDPAAVLVAADAFIQKNGASQLIGEARGLRMIAYLNQKKFTEAVDELDKALEFNKKFYADRDKETKDKNSPQLAELFRHMENNELDYYKRFLNAAQVANNVKATVLMGDLILARIPNDVPTLLAVATVVAGKPPSDAAEKEKVLAGAEEMGQLAVNYIWEFLNSQNSAGLPPEQRAEWNYRAHSLMGFIYTQKQNYGDAEKAYKVALSYKKNDGAAYYYLGYGYYQAKKWDQAIDAAQKSAFLKGPYEPDARNLLRAVYSQTKRPVVDMDKDIQAAGERLPKP